jgi:hypothetical protein
VSSAEGQGLWTLAFASSWQTGHCASAIWKFLLVFALARSGQVNGPCPQIADQSDDEREARLFAVDRL